MYLLPKIKTSVYGYANARVHGMKGLLLTKTNYEELANVKSIDAMVELLQKTHYKEHLLEATVKYSDSLLVESASGKHYAAIVKKLRKITPKGDKEIIDALLMKWDVINLKTVIASKKTNSTFQEILPKLIYAGSLSPNVLESIHEAKDILNELKKTDFGRELFAQSIKTVGLERLSKFKKALSKTDEYSQIQAMLDTFSYFLMEKYLQPYISDPDVRKIFELLRKEIATKNILIIQRLKKSNIKDGNLMEKYLISGGSLDPRAKSILTSSTKKEDVLRVIKKYLPSFNTENIDDLISLEIDLQKALSKEKIKIFHRTILSIGTILGFLLIKEEEMNNLRKIAKAKEFGIDSKEVMNTLLLSG